MKQGKALFLSIKPRFAEQIFAGTKTVELRRVRPRVSADDVVVVYASGETKALLGAFQIVRVVSGKPSTIWRRFSKSAGLARREFDEYFAGAETAYAIEIAHTWRLPTPVCLPMLREKKRGFRPPQGYHYLDFGTLSDIGGDALLGGRRVATPKR
jgi:predicted transcriptional regulator